MSLPLLFRKKARQRSRVKNYRSARFFTARLTTAFFRLSVPLFVRNAGARNLCLREARGFGLLFLCFCLNRISALGARRNGQTSYALSLKAEKLLCGITPPLPKKSTSALAREKLSLCSVFHGSFDYRFFSVKRSSRWSERKRSELLFEKNVRLRASFLCFTFYMRLTARVGTGKHLTHFR